MTVFISIMKQTEIHLACNQKKNRYYMITFHSIWKEIKLCSLSAIHQKTAILYQKDFYIGFTWNFYRKLFDYLFIKTRECEKLFIWQFDTCRNTLLYKTIRTFIHKRLEHSKYSSYETHIWQAEKCHNYTSICYGRGERHTHREIFSKSY